MPLLIAEYCFCEKYSVLFKQQDEEYTGEKQKEDQGELQEAPLKSFTSPISYLVIS